MRYSAIILLLQTVKRNKEQYQLPLKVVSYQVMCTAIWLKAGDPHIRLILQYLYSENLFLLSYIFCIGTLWLDHG